MEPFEADVCWRLVCMRFRRALIAEKLEESLSLDHLKLAEVQKAPSLENGSKMRSGKLKKI